MAQKHWILPTHTNVTSKVGLTLVGPPCRLNWTEVHKVLQFSSLQCDVNASLGWARYSILVEWAFCCANCKVSSERTPSTGVAWLWFITINSVWWSGPASTVFTLFHWNISCFSLPFTFDFTSEIGLHRPSCFIYICREVSLLVAQARDQHIRDH